MLRTADMFAGLKKPRAKPCVMMHGTDFSFDGMVHLECKRCGHDADWIYMRKDSDAMRGLPCHNCNSERERAEWNRRNGWWELPNG